MLRPGVDGAKLEVEGVRCFGVGSMLLRRLLATLGGRAARRAMGLSSIAPLSVSSSTIDACRADAGVEERGVERMGSLPFAGVAGECIGLARGRRPWAGVVEPVRVEGGGDRADERLRGLRSGIEDMLDALLLKERGDVSVPLL